MAIEIPAAYGNLLKDGTLNPADRDLDEINQYIKVASDSLRDAKNADMSAHSRYMLAYEGVHSLATAILLNFGTRPGSKDGHRNVALQRLCAELLLDAGAHKSIMDAHKRRNAATYRSALPPVTHKEAEAVIAILSGIIPKVKALIAQADDTNENKVPPSSTPKHF